MRILVTGAKGFIGKNLVCALKNNGYKEILEFDIDSERESLGEYCGSCDFVFHLAGVNRPQNNDEFRTGNYDLTEDILKLLRESGNKCPFMYASSVQAEFENPYGKSKREAEEIILRHTADMESKALIYRFPNVFGKWCRPNYNSAVATFCHNIANNLPIIVNDRDTVLNLVYIDDLTDELLKALENEESRDGDFCFVPVTHTEKLGVIADTIRNFPNCRSDLSIPDHSEALVKKLYSTYLSYLPEEKFKYPLKMNIDGRGSFTEFIRTPDRGQISVNVIKPGIVKGNHWHDSKNEKFLAVQGKGVIRFRLPDNANVFEVEVSGGNLEVVDIPPGYTHNIENTYDTDMVVVIWVNEPFDPDNPDTYYLEV